MKKHRNNKGFTLIELLATISVLGLVLVIVIYVALNIITKAKEKSYEVTVNNIEKSAGNYLVENKDKLYFIESGDIEYQCVSVQNLIDMGYLNNEVTKSKVDNDTYVGRDNYVYIERDSETKTITQNVYIKDSNSGYGNYCEVASKVQGEIVISSNPKASEWAREKEVTILYRLKNLNDVNLVGSYGYNYTYSGTYDVINGNGMTKKINVTSNGNLYADIKQGDETLASNSLEISKIDREGPIVTHAYTGDLTVRNRVVIPLKARDLGAGIDYSSFTVDDIIVTIGGVTIDEKKLTHMSGESYSLTITDNYNEGPLVLTIPAGRILDVLRNENDTLIINTGVTFSNKYNVTYVKGTCPSTAGGSTASNVATYNQDFVTTPNGFTCLGYSFNGWKDNKSTSWTLTSLGVYENGNGTKPLVWKYTEDRTLTAQWKINSYTLTYDCSTNGGSGDTTEVVQYNGSVDLTKTCTKDGWTFVGWHTSRTATSKLSSYSMPASDATLYGIYKKSVSIKFYKNGATNQTKADGTTSTSSYVTKSCTLYNNATSCAVTSPTITRDGFTILGYSTNINGESAEVNQNTAFNVSDSANYYAITKKDVTITFNRNGAEKQTDASGTAVTSDTVTRSCTIWNSANNCSVTSPTITPGAGYTAVGYNTSSSATTSSWNQNMQNTVTEDKTYYAIRSGNTYNINYYQGDLNSGVKKLGTTSCTYNSPCKLAKYAGSTLNGVIPYSSADTNNTNYSWYFYGWSVTQKGVKSSYSDEASFTFTGTSDLNLYAIGYRNFRFNSGIAPATLPTAVEQYWNMDSLNSVTRIKIPAATTINGFTFVGYKGQQYLSVANETNVTFAASTVGTEQQPAYNIYTYNRALYKRTLTVNYNANGGTGTTNASTLTQYYNSGYGDANGNHAASLSSNEITLAASSYSKAGHTFSKWNTKSDGSGDSYSAGGKYSGIGTSVEDTTVSKTMYAKWRKNKVYVKFDANGGSFASEYDSKHYSLNGNTVLYTNDSGNTSDVVHSLDYDGTLGENGLINYNNKNALNLVRTGYTAPSGEEWICASGCTTANKKFSQSTQYSVSDFCNASSGDCTVTLKVNWQKTVKVTFNKNDGGGATVNQTFTYGVSGNRFGYNTDGTPKWEQTGEFGAWKRTGYTLKGWAKTASATSSDYTIYSNVTDSWINTNSPSINLYAVWENSLSCWYITSSTRSTGCRTEPKMIDANGNLLNNVVTYVGGANERWFTIDAVTNNGTYADDDRSTTTWYHSRQKNCWLYGGYMSQETFYVNEDGSCGSAGGSSNCPCNLGGGVGYGNAPNCPDGFYYKNGILCHMVSDGRLEECCQ